MDILLSSDGDLYINEKGDITLVDSVRQKILIRIRWWLGEWRWDDEEGLPYKDELFIKNPDTDEFEMNIRDKIFDVDEVTEVQDVTVAYDRKTRIGTVSFTALTDSETISEEVCIDGGIWSN